MSLILNSSQFLRHTLTASYRQAGLARHLGAPLKESIEVRDRINSGQIPGPSFKLFK